jgi:hypothetical protein
MCVPTTSSKGRQPDLRAPKKLGVSSKSRRLKEKLKNTIRETANTTIPPAPTEASFQI